MTEASKRDALVLKNVAVRFGEGGRAVAAVTGANLTIPPGRTFGLVGESGSGKSTLAKAIVGLAPISAGSVLVHGRDVVRPRGDALKFLRTSVQLVIQNPHASLNPRMTAGATLAEAMACHKRGRRGEGIAHWFGLVGLDRALGDRFPHELSGGQLQRLAIARALSTGADLLILDEVTSALDVSVQAHILNMLKQLQQQRGLTYLFISHDLDVVRYMSDAVGVMRAGEIVETGPARRLLASPAHAYTKKLIAALPRLDSVQG